MYFKVYSGLQNRSSVGFSEPCSSTIVFFLVGGGGKGGLGGVINFGTCALPQYHPIIR